MRQPTKIAHWFLLSFWGLVLAACSGAPRPAPAPFTLEPAQTTLEVRPGGEVSSFVLLRRSAGFGEVVEMSLLDLPPGLEQTWSRDSENGDCSLIVSAADDLPEGRYTLTLRGEIRRGGGAGETQSLNVSAQTISQPLTLNVVAASSGGFSVSAQPSVLALPQDSETEIRVRFSPTAGAGNAQFSFVDLPAGVSMAAVTGALSFGGERVIRVRVAADAAPGSRTIGMTVSAGGQTHSLSLSLIVQPAVSSGPTSGLRLLTSSLNLRAQAGSSVSVRLTLVRIGLFNPIGTTLSLKGSPNGFSASPVSLADNSLSGELVIRNTVDAPVGTTSLKVQATSGLIPKTTETSVAVTVTPPAGVLDTSFGGIGLVIQGNDLEPAVQPNDGILVGSRIGGGAVLRRYHPDGLLDTTFGAAGSTTVQFPGLSDTEEGDIRALPDGKILLHLLFEDGNRNNLALARLLPSGQLDTTFGSGGRKVIGGLERSGNANSASAVLPNGKINLAHADRGRVLLMRLNPDGSEDTTFGSGGSELLSNTPLERIGDNGMTLAPSGKILLSGENQGSFNDDDLVVVRRVASGGRDSSFAGGFVRQPLGTLEESAEFVTSDVFGRAVVAASRTGGVGNKSDLFVLRFRESGSLDSTFSSDGVLTLDFDDTDLEEGLAVQPDGKILVMVSDPQILVRLNSNGSFDDSFSGDGRVQMPSEIGTAVRVLLDSKGRIVAVGNKGIARLVP
jgi:uncharacterized delta-60 repeat protein